ncbi:MAG TPA: peptidoglycan DD-metalloendopeptidase family protein [Acetobacteraceae bacterium]|nr:peptidoglycan DD-metalloendopeptidase family protein [Acetobacteraceae bacterium]
MRSRPSASLLLILLAAASPPDAPGSARKPAAGAPATEEQARQALESAEASQKAALAAARQAAAAAEEAARKRALLTAQRVKASEQLRLAETAIEEMALRLDQLGQERAREEAALTARARAFAPVLPLLERLSLYPAETLLAVPASPEDALRGVLVLQGVAKDIERQAAALRAEQARVEKISAEIAAQNAALKMAEAQQEEDAALLDREIEAASESEAKSRSEAAAATTAAAREAAQARTLQGVIASLQAAAARAAEAAREAAARRSEAARQAEVAREEKVSLARPPVPAPSTLSANGAPVGGAPVAGVLVSAYGAPTPAGPANGIRYQTAPGAHVLAPCSGMVEFAAPFRSYGQLVILDCGNDYRFVLAGMTKLLVSAGSSVSAGEAVGVMAGWDPDSKASRPTLYLELHHGGQAVNPLPWLHARG